MNLHPIQGDANLVTLLLKLEKNAGLMGHLACLQT